MPRVDLHDVEADRLLRMARTKARLGRAEQAITHYDEALARRAGFAEAFLEVVELLTAAQDWAGIARRCATWIEHHPDHASHGLSDRVHNLRIDALCRVGGIDLAYDAYGLEQITQGPIELAHDQIVAVVVARNERSRLEFLLQHHRWLGVDRFLFVDNGSDDGSVEYLVGEPDTIVWRTTGSFLRSNEGVAWTDLVLRRHAPPQWCLVLDADELFIYPRFEHRALRALCAELDRHGATCYQAIELDMYGGGPLSEGLYRAGQDPLEVFPYFDSVYYRLRIPFDGPRRNMTNFWGGVRARIFGGDLGGYLLNKVPLFRYAPGEILMSGQHWLSRPTGEIASGRGALMHFKYTAQFARTVHEEVARKEHAHRAAVYEQYARALDIDPDPIFFGASHSTRYRSSGQLVELGVMLEGPATARVAVTRDTVLIPAIPAVLAVPEHQPFWSVVVVLRPEDDVRERVERVVRALGDAPPSEVVVVGSGPSRNAVDVLGTGTGRSHAIVMATTPEHLTDVEAANFGLGHTQGVWVHVLGPDTPSPCFYEATGEAVKAPGVALVVAHGPHLDHAIDLDFGMRSSCFVAARALYEQAGGFCATIALAAAWEIVQRLAHTARRAPTSVSVASHPVPGSDARPSSAFAGYGEEVVHWLAAIDLVSDVAGLTAADVAALHDRCAAGAAHLVRDDVEHGRFGSALATVGEVLRAPITAESREVLAAALARTL
ncbi:MAG TPA: glycosyltransferase family 2 protein [Aeromicrobium sp.]|nr:glycosyltransferase family 2 protein [Aeromicrobium sp.]